MALDKQIINLPIVGGLDTKTDEKQLAPVDFTELENVLYSTPKAFVKRPGFDVLPSTTPTSTLPTILNGLTPQAVSSSPPVAFQAGGIRRVSAVLSVHP